MKQHTVHSYRPLGLPGSFLQSCFQTGRSQPVLHCWIMFFQVQNLTLVLVGFYQVLVSPFCQPIEDFLQSGSPFLSVHLPTQFAIISKVHQGTHFILSSKSLMKTFNSVRSSEENLVLNKHLRVGFCVKYFTTWYSLCSSRKLTLKAVLL